MSLVKRVVSLNSMSKARRPACCWRIGVISSLEVTVHCSGLDMVDVADMVTGEGDLRFGEKSLGLYPSDSCRLISLL